MLQEQREEITTAVLAKPGRTAQVVVALTLLLNLTWGTVLAHAQAPATPTPPVTVPPPDASPPPATPPSSAAPPAAPPPAAPPPAAPPAAAAPPLTTVPAGPPTGEPSPPPTAAPPPTEAPPPAPPTEPTLIPAAPQPELVPAPDIEPLSAPPLTPETAPAEQPSKIPAYVLWGAGGVSLIVGTIYGVSALSAKSDFDDKPTYSKADQVYDRSIGADVGFGLGLVLAITGTLFYFVADAPATPTEQARNPSKPRTTPTLSSRAGGGALTLHF